MASLLRDHPLSDEVREMVGTIHYSGTALVAIINDVLDFSKIEAGKTRRIRELEGDGPRIPIVALTAHAMEGDRIRCQEAGMDDHITKPIDLKLVATVLSRLLRGNSKPGDSKPADQDAT